MLCDPREHAWANLVAIMERENVIRKSCPLHSPMRSGLSLDGPARSHERRKNAVRLYSWPAAHAA
jgi:hypothetical protein